MVSNRVAGVDINMNYNIFGNQILRPDVTIFVSAKEDIRSTRIERRGKDVLDRVLDDEETRKSFIKEFGKNLPSDTIYVDNSSDDIKKIASNTLERIKFFESFKRGIYLDSSSVEFEQCKSYILEEYKMRFDTIAKYTKMVNTDSRVNPKVKVKTK